MYDVDLHTHTRFFHGFEGEPTAYDPLGVRLLTLFARRHHLDGVALTNHDYDPGFDSHTGVPQFIPGIEVSTTMGHVLIVGPDPPQRTEPGQLVPKETVELAHENDCAAIIAHPFRRSTVRESGTAFDAVELNGKHPDSVDRVRSLASRLDLPIVGGSDAHFPFEVGRAFTSIDAPHLTPESVVTAIREGAVETRLRTTPMDWLFQSAYRIIHRYR